ncbi:hypothetical protein BASA84_001278 [Batrachochytrium salamandrivorans]|nr:hypothetical protein BASA84_001278 [Batrachochytrium salamandrivorans]
MRPTQALATAFKKTVSISLKISAPPFRYDQHYNLRPSNNMLLAVSIKKPHEFLGDFSVDIKDVQADGQCFDYSNTTLYRDQAQSGIHHALTGDTGHLAWIALHQQGRWFKIYKIIITTRHRRVQLVSILINIHPWILVVVDPILHQYGMQSYEWGHRRAV